MSVLLTEAETVALPVAIWYTNMSHGGGEGEGDGEWEGEGEPVTLQPLLEDSKVANIINSSFVYLDTSSNVTNVTLYITGAFLGKTQLLMESSNSDIYNTGFEIRVQRRPRKIDTAFLVLFGVFVAAFTVAFACSLDLAIVKERLQRPHAVVIALLCQFVLMPSLSYAISRAFGLSRMYSFGMLAYGCSPGGGGSNMWTVLLKGDVHLSVTLTLLSNLASIATMPLWLFTLGQHILGDDVTLPWGNVLLTLAVYVATCVIGMLIKRFLPRVAKALEKIVMVLALILLLFFTTLGTYANLYIFKLLTSWRIIVGGTLIPYLGFCISGCIAWLCGLPPRIVRTIAIETSIQNFGVALLILKYSLPAPDGDLSAVCPLAGAILIPPPLAIVALGMWLYNRTTKVQHDITLGEETRSGRCSTVVACCSTYHTASVEKTGVVAGQVNQAYTANESEPSKLSRETNMASRANESEPSKLSRETNMASRANESEPSKLSRDTNMASAESRDSGASDDVVRNGSDLNANVYPTDRAYFVSL